MGDLAEAQKPVPVAASDTTAVLNMIERVALDPNVDPDKMDRLLDVQERILNKQAEQEFFAALNHCQRHMGRVATDCDNRQTRSKYASYAALDRALRPIYTEQGMSLSFDTETSEIPEHLKVVCYVSHTSGFTKRYSVNMPADGKGAKGGDVMTKTHATGAAMSYGMRYLLKMIFNVAIGEDDTDGNMPTSEPDCTDWIAKFDECTTLDELKGVYKEAYEANKKYPRNLERINSAKDLKKKEIARGPKN